MIREEQGNLLDAEVEAIVNTVNTVGVMGKGIALQFKQAFPANYRAYQKACKEGRVKLGEMFIYDTHRLGLPRYIINFPTKGHWRSRSRIRDIDQGLDSLVGVVQKYDITSIAIPALGCGNGGLDWAEVKPLIEKAFSALPDVEVILFPPVAAPKPEDMPVGTQDPGMTKGRAALIALMDRYIEKARSERFEAPDGVSLLEVQKIMYFLQVMGEPMRLAYAKGRYGPYAENLNHQLQRMEGHYVRGYGDRSQLVLDLYPMKLMPGAVETSTKWIHENSTDLDDSINRVMSLVDGFASPYGLELLGTVHWVARKEISSPGQMDDLISRVQKWSRRKADLFTKGHIKAAYRQLVDNEML